MTAFGVECPLRGKGFTGLYQEGPISYPEALPWLQVTESGGGKVTEVGVPAALRLHPQLSPHSV